MDLMEWVVNDDAGRFAGESLGLGLATFAENKRGGRATFIVPTHSLLAEGLGEQCVRESTRGDSLTHFPPPP